MITSINTRKVFDIIKYPYMILTQIDIYSLEIDNKMSLTAKKTGRYYESQIWVAMAWNTDWGCSVCQVSLWKSLQELFRHKANNGCKSMHWVNTFWGRCVGRWMTAKWRKSFLFAFAKHIEHFNIYLRHCKLETTM